MASASVRAETFKNAPLAEASTNGLRSPLRCGRKSVPSHPAGAFAAAASRSRSEFRPSGRSARRAHSAFPPAVTIDAATIAKSGFGCDSRNVPSLAAFASVVSHGAHVAIHPLVPR